MSDNVARTLEILFSMPMETVGHDLEMARTDPDGVMSHLRRTSVPTNGQESPEDKARWLHDQMVSGHAVATFSGVPEDLAFFSIAYAAEQVAEYACEVADDRGRLRELSESMRRIQVREGLRDGEYWSIGDGPEDYVALSNEADSLNDRIFGTVITSVLRRYGYAHFADLFDADRGTFEAMREVGRRLAL